MCASETRLGRHLIGLHCLRGKCSEVVLNINTDQPFAVRAEDQLTDAFVVRHCWSEESSSVQIPDAKLGFRRDGQEPAC
jgi:hypothetical protein